MSLNDRIALVRKSLKITQKDFGDKIGVAANTITNYEAGRRDPMEGTIKAICREFKVNYDWLKTGDGIMFESIADDAIQDLIKEFNLDFLDQKIVLEYLKLNPEERAVIKKYIQSVWA